MPNAPASLTPLMLRRCHESINTDEGAAVANNIFDLTGKVALVTGGSKGLGKAMARGLAEAGADIVIASRHEDELKPALDEILEGTGREGSTSSPT